MLAPAVETRNLASAALERALSHARVFAGWPEPALKQIASRVRVYRYPARQTIIEQGAAVDGLYLIVSGQMEITWLRPDGRHYTRKVAESGLVFGFLALFDGGGSPQFYFARRQTDILFIPRDALFDILSQYPDCWFTLVREMARYQRAALDALEQATFDNNRGRLTRLLVALADSHGETVNGVTSIKFSQESLGSLLGVSRQTVSKDLNAMVDEQLLDIIYGGVAIRDVDALRATLADTSHAAAIPSSSSAKRRPSFTTTST